LNSKNNNVGNGPIAYSIIFGAITVSALIVFINISRRLKYNVFISILTLILSRSIRNRDKEAVELILNELFKSKNITKIEFYSKIITINKEKPDFHKNNKLLTKNFYYRNIYLGSLDAYVAN
jgi:low affinity Fe/Cu permease